MTPLTALALQVRSRLARLGDDLRHRVPVLRRVPALPTLLELAARVGYGARGFVYLSIGAMALLAALDKTGSSVGGMGVLRLVADQPFGRLWLILLGLGLWSFVLWRVLQSIFDADRAGWSRKALAVRAGQAASGVFYAILAGSIFELLDDYERSSSAEDTAEAQDKAQALLALPFGDWLLLLAGVVILAMGVGNVLKGASGDFAGSLSCDVRLSRRVVPIARAGYIARGLAYLPLGLFVVLGGLHARAADVRSFGASLDALERQPGGSLVLGLTAVGIMAFGAFALVEARYRRIRAPKDLSAH